jgi:Zn finger protein HypA/HybF involved in hydrogenase expression
METCGHLWETAVGSIHQAHCECGFSARFPVGGGRADFRYNSPFPFYCKECGLVLGNTAKKPIVCPTCGTSDIAQYGKPPVSTAHGEHEHSYVLCAFDYRAWATGNLCPACKQMTLEFSKTEVLFD